MKKLLLLLFCAAIPFLLHAQGEGNIWMMVGFGIDFSSGTAELVVSADDFTFSSATEGTASVCDASGTLLFYTNGDDVFNRENEMMPDGAAFSGLGCWSTTQAATIIPVPGSDSLFYIFSLGFDVGYTGLHDLKYSLVDMSLDGGLGNIVSSTGSTFVNDSLSEKMTIVRGCNSTWLVVFKYNESNLYAYPITDDGPGEPVLSHLSSFTPAITAQVGELKFSEDGSKMAMVNWQNPFLLTLDFSTETGEFSEPEILIDEVITPGYMYSAAFSSDGSKLYVSTGGKIAQFDLSLGDLDDIIASQTVVSGDYYIEYFSSLKLGPDGKIYLNTRAEICVINSPNLAGTACDFEFGIFYPEELGLGGFFGNFPNAALRSNYEFADTPITSSRDTTICAAMALSGRSGALSYEWNDGSTLPNLTIDTGGIYYVSSTTACAVYIDTFHVKISEIYSPIITLRDTLLCTTTSSLRIAASIDSAMATTFHWEPASAVISGGDDSVVWVDPTMASVFYLTATNHTALCESSAIDSIAVSFFNNSIEIVAPGDTTICAGDEVAITAILPAGYTASWSPDSAVSNPHASSTIFMGDISTSLTLTSSLGHCSASDTLSITVEPMPVVAVGNDTMLCDYEQYMLSPEVAPAGFPGLSYSWSPASLLDDASARNPVFSSAPDSGFLKLTVSTPAGCTGSDSLYWKVRTSDFMTLSGDTGMCPPVSIPLTAGNANSYLWLPAYGLSSDTIENPVASPHTSTNYLVMGTSAFGCIDSQYVLVEVYPAAAVYLQDTAMIYPGESFQIDPEGNAVNYSWFPPSGLSASNIANPIASPEVRTRYFYTATTEHGCSLRDSIDILVSTESVMDMPNAFVPGNGKNATFRLSIRGIASLNSFTIFNRWGNKVFETTDIAEGWDGSYNGTPQPMGVYLYTIDAVSGTGKQFIKQGNVTLIR